MRGKLRAIIFDVPLKPEGTLRLAELDDGRMAILRDDALIDGQLWPPDQVEASVTAFRTLQRSLTESNGHPQPAEEAVAV